MEISEELLSLQIVAIVHVFKVAIPLKGAISREGSDASINSQMCSPTPSVNCGVETNTHHNGRFENDGQRMGGQKSSETDLQTV